jgi:hypothetical protein
LPKSKMPLEIDAADSGIGDAAALGREADG